MKIPIYGCRCIGKSAGGPLDTSRTGCLPAGARRPPDEPAPERHTATGHADRAAGECQDQIDDNGFHPGEI